MKRSKRSAVVHAFAAIPRRTPTEIALAALASGALAELEQAWTEIDGSAATARTFAEGQKVYDEPAWTAARDLRALAMRVWGALTTARCARAG